jgi:hypothetical protein
LIKTWVLTKQLNQSSIKNYGLGKPNAEKIQDKYTKCMIATQIIDRNYKMIGQNSFEIKEAPTIKDAIALMDLVSNWPDKLVELEIWSQLAILAGKLGQTDNLRYAHFKALESLSYFEKKKLENKTVYLTSQYLLGEACIALGEHLASLINNNSAGSSNSKNNQQQQRDPATASASTIKSVADASISLRRDALNAFADGCSYSAHAENYENSILSARHYWNICIPYLSQAQERATLYDNLNEIIQSLQLAYKYKPAESDLKQQNLNETEQSKQQEERKESDDNKKSKKSDPKVAGAKGGHPPGDTKQANKPGSAQKRQNEPIAAAATSIIITEPVDKFNPMEDAFDDLTLRCVFYACLFQISIDKHEYEEALEQMEEALNDLPRTKHRLLIYRFKVITKSKLGLDVQMDLQKFREESEKNLAQMYRKVALSSAKHVDTINCYQRAIEALSVNFFNYLNNSKLNLYFFFTFKSESSTWLKFEYILEFAQWLYSHEYQLSNCIDLCEWAIDIIMFNLKIEKSLRTISASSTSKQSKASTQASKAKLNKTQQQTNINLVPIVEDDTDSKQIHKQIEKNADSQMENVDSAVNSENLFGNINKLCFLIFNNK